MQEAKWKERYPDYKVLYTSSDYSSSFTTLIRAGLKMRTNLVIHREVQAQHCANDIEYFNWSRKMCFTNTRGYDSKSDTFGIPVNLRQTELPYISDDIFKGKSILFVGDSHMRGIVKSFLYDVMNIYMLVFFLIC